MFCRTYQTRLCRLNLCSWIVIQREIPGYVKIILYGKDKTVLKGFYNTFSFTQRDYMMSCSFYLNCSKITENTHKSLVKLYDLKKIIQISFELIYFQLSCDSIDGVNTGFDRDFYNRPNNYDMCVWTWLMENSGAI